jgi:hypothetical protein
MKIEIHWTSPLKVGPVHLDNPAVIAKLIINDTMFKILVRPPRSRPGIATTFVQRIN